MAKLHFNGPSSAFIPLFTDAPYMLPILPSQSSGLGRETRVLKAQFGDGYSARALDGINSSTLNVSLMFKNRSNRIITAIDDFLRGASPFNREQHEAFFWTPPAPFNAEELLFVCEEKWDIVWGEGNIATLTCKFVQVFDL